MKISPPLSLAVQFADTRHKAQLPRPLLRAWVNAALQRAPESAELTLRFASEAESAALNQDFRKRGYVPNVLTFSYSQSPCLADVVICPAVIEREAAEQSKPLVAHYAHMVVHGVLHARGFDHRFAREAKLMERLEAELLKSLGFSNPY